MAKKPELITWSNTISCGIQLIDEQHKTLVDLVNDMFNHISGNEEEEQEYLKKVLKTAVKYVKLHFATEERIFLATKFYGYAEHKKAHDLFILTVTDKIRDFQTGKRVTLSSISNFLKDWILSHIAVMDKQYFVFFRQIATRKANGRLSIDMSDVNRGFM